MLRYCYTHVLQVVLWHFEVLSSELKRSPLNVSFVLIVPEVKKNINLTANFESTRETIPVIYSNEHKKKLGKKWKVKKKTCLQSSQHNSKTIQVK